MVFAINKIVFSSIKKIASVNNREILFSHRKFYCNDNHTQAHLERIGFDFLQGYHSVWETNHSMHGCFALDGIAYSKRTPSSQSNSNIGFAIEGGAFACTILDLFVPNCAGNIEALLKKYGAKYDYLIYVGMGWFFAKFRWKPMRIVKQISDLDPLLKWLIWDGYGFYHGFFNGHLNNSFVKTLDADDYRRKAIDQGFGRSIWFQCGGDIEQIFKKVNTFSSQRHGDLYSGVGLASAYACGVDEKSIAQLKDISTKYLPNIAQGVAFACKSRVKAGNLLPETEMVSEIICEMSAKDAANITDAALVDLPIEDTMPNYEIWKQRIQSNFKTVCA